MNSSEKFIIIGSNSFSGASFVNYILQDNPKSEIIGISRSPEYKDCFLPYKCINNGNFRFIQYDLNKDLNNIIKIIHEFRPDYIVNFAAQGMVAQSWSDPEQWFRTNCLAIMNLVNNLSGEIYLKRYIQISSPEIYGPCKNISEADAKIKPSTPYAASKACGDISLYPFFLNRGVPVVFTRATNVYGPYQQLYRIIPRAVVSIRKGVKIPLQGEGKAIKSYIHIRDVCDATLRIARKGVNGEVYHISPDGEGISIYNLVQRISKKMGKNMEDCVEFVGDRLGQDHVYVINSSKIRNELGWKPQADLDQGLDEVINWVDKYYAELVKLPMDYVHRP